VSDNIPIRFTKLVLLFLVKNNIPMQLFYTPDITGKKYFLNEQESKHCVRVLRMHMGDILHLTNGLGTLYKAEIINANVKACELNVVEELIDFNKRNYRLQIAIAPTKNIDRYEWFLEKATEIGIDEITPLLCEHSERKVIKSERLERVIVAAMKQSVKAYKPTLSKLSTFKEFMQLDFSGTNCFIAHCQEGQREFLKAVLSPKSDTCILIGPEGDFSPEEIGIATAKGFQPVSLGQERLRTETAGVIACHSVSFINQ
jgi:16S rRNA (uracil1498-N3)-methyltransferase